MEKIFFGTNTAGWVGTKTNENHAVSLTCAQAASRFVGKYFLCVQNLKKRFFKIPIYVIFFFDCLKKNQNYSHLVSSTIQDYESKVFNLQIWDFMCATPTVLLSLPKKKLKKSLPNNFRKYVKQRTRSPFLLSVFWWCTYWTRNDAGLRPAPPSPNFPLKQIK